MRILIISDTHGRTNTIRDVLDTVGDIDMFIHLGDVCGDEEYIYDNVTCPIHMVAGITTGIPIFRCRKNS